MAAFDFKTIVYYEMFNGATESGIQLLDGDADNVDEIGVIVRVSGYSCPGDSSTPPYDHRDVEVVDIELGWEGEFTKDDLLPADIERIAALLQDDLDNQDIEECGV